MKTDIAHVMKRKTGIAIFVLLICILFEFIYWGNGPETVEFMMNHIMIDPGPPSEEYLGNYRYQLVVHYGLDHPFIPFHWLSGD